jgi:hypothetical protein
LSSIKIKKRKRVNYYKGKGPKANQEEAWRNGQKLRRRLRAARSFDAGMTPRAYRQIILREAEERQKAEAAKVVAEVEAEGRKTLSALGKLAGKIKSKLQRDPDSE